MNAENFAKALSIISKSNSVNVSFNVPVTDNYSNVHQILLHESNATLVKDLVEAGFSLFPGKKGISIDKF